jgi:GMP synthase PP-ATPase subunit
MLRLNRLRAFWQAFAVLLPVKTVGAIGRE